MSKLTKKNNFKAGDVVWHNKYGQGIIFRRWSWHQYDVKFDHFTREDIPGGYQRCDYTHLTLVS